MQNNKSNLIKMHARNKEIKINTGDVSSGMVGAKMTENGPKEDRGALGFCKGTDRSGSDRPVLFMRTGPVRMLV